MLESIRQTIYDAFYAETQQERLDAIRDGETLRPMLEELAGTYDQHGVPALVPGLVEEMFGEGLLAVELYGAQWFCNRLGHCGFNEPQHELENWAAVQWRLVDPEKGPRQIWWLMMVEWVDDRWKLRYKSFCDFQDERLEALDEILGVALDVRCPPDPRAGDTSWFRRGTLGWRLSSDDSNVGKW